MENKKAILYVDDEKNNIFLFQKLFEKKFTILTAISGQDALNTLEEHKGEIHFVISDMRMPGMNGIEFIKKAKLRYDQICYYILSGFDLNEEITDAIDQNIVTKYFSKPLQVDEIEETIKKIST